MRAEWLRPGLWLLVLAVAGWFLLRIQNTLSIFALAWVIAYLLSPVVEALELGRVRFLPPMTRLRAILLVFSLLLGLLATGLSLLVPLANEQAGNIARQLPDQLQQLQQGAEGLWARYLQQVPAEVRARVESVAENLTSQLGAALRMGFERLTGFVSGFFSLVFLVLTSMLISLNLLGSWRSLGEGALGWIPRAYQEDARALATQMNAIFGGYLRALIVTSLVCGVATFAVLFGVTLSFGVDFPYTLILSVVAGITYGIPLVGALVGSGLGALLAFVSSGDVGFTLAATLGIFLVNMIIDRTLFPRLTGEAMGVSELLVLFGAFAGGELLGIWGMLLGIPGAAMVKALFSWFHDRFLVSQVEPPPCPDEASAAPAPPDEAVAPPPAAACPEGGGPGVEGSGPGRDQPGDRPRGGAASGRRRGRRRK